MTQLVTAGANYWQLFGAAQLIAERKEAFARDMTREMRKVLDETRGDVQEAIDMTYFLAGEGRRLHGHTAPSELRDKFAMSIRQPVGSGPRLARCVFGMEVDLRGLQRGVTESAD